MKRWACFLAISLTILILTGSFPVGILGEEIDTGNVGDDVNNSKELSGYDLSSVSTVGKNEEMSIPRIFEEQGEVLTATALNSSIETETMDTYCGWDCNITYVSDTDVPVVFDGEDVPFSYLGDRKDVLDHYTDSYSLFFAIHDSGTYTINAVNTNTGSVLKKYIINVEPEITDLTICAGNNDWVYITSDNNLVFDKTDSIEVLLRNTTCEPFEIDSNPYNVVNETVINPPAEAGETNRCRRRCVE